MNPRTFTDRNGDEITISECDDGACVTMEDRHACVSGGNLGGIVAALYEATGLPAPIILEGCGGVTKATIGGVRVYLAGSKVGIDGNQELPPALARQVARILVRVADAAESEPDPGEVAELAKVIRDAPGLNMLSSSDAIARAALRWMRNRVAAP